MGRRFFEQAEQDLVFARRNVEIGGHYVAANLAHQAAEKALKAAHWHVLAEEPEWSHQLVAVAARVAQRVGSLPTEVAEAIEVLTPVYTRTRYPSGSADEPIPANMIQQQDAQTAIDVAEEVMAWARALLQQSPGRAQRKTRS